jgi:hypothetical protein
MDPIFRRDENEEKLLHDMINDNEGQDVTRRFLNDSGEGDESLHREEASDGRQVGSGSASGGTFNLENTGEVDIYVNYC